MPLADPEARRQYQEQYWQANKSRYRTQQHATRDRQRALMRQTIQDAKDCPCADCEVKYPYYVMHFDHLGDKEFNIGHWRGGLARLRAEIAKCDVVCANCHAERSHQRRLLADQASNLE